MAKAIKDDEQDTAGLIEVSKDGETLFVHPTTLDAHKQAGWKEAE